MSLKRNIFYTCIISLAIINSANSMDTGNPQNVLSKITTGMKGVAAAGCCYVAATFAHQAIRSIYNTARGLDNTKGRRIFSYRRRDGRQLLALCGLVSAISGYGTYRFGKSFFKSLQPQ